MPTSEGTISKGQGSLDSPRISPPSFRAEGTVLTVVVGCGTCPAQKKQFRRHVGLTTSFEHSTELFSLVLASLLVQTWVVVSVTWILPVHDRPMIESRSECVTNTWETIFFGAYSPTPEISPGIKHWCGIWKTMETHGKPTFVYMCIFIAWLEGTTQGSES